MGIRVKGEKIFTQPHSVAVWWVVSDAADAPLENPQVSPPSPPPSPPESPQPPASQPKEEAKDGKKKAYCVPTRKKMCIAAPSIFDDMRW